MESADVFEQMLLVEQDPLWAILYDSDPPGGLHPHQAADGDIGQLRGRVVALNQPIQITVEHGRAILVSVGPLRATGCFISDRHRLNILLGWFLHDAARFCINYRFHKFEYANSAQNLNSPRKT
jgi:hypothetical protein